MVFLAQYQQIMKNNYYRPIKPKLSDWERLVLIALVFILIEKYTSISIQKYTI